MKSHSHPDPRPLEAYVLGILEGDEAEEVESHCAACESCQAALMREAQLERGLAEAAARLNARPRRTPVRRMAVPLAAAAVLLVALVGSLLHSTPAPEVAFILPVAGAPPTALAILNDRMESPDTMPIDRAELDALNDPIDRVITLQSKGARP